MNDNEPKELLEYEELLEEEGFHENSEEQEYIDSAEGKLRLVAEAATDAAKKVLLKRGWFPDPNNDWDFTMFEVERMLMEYVEKYPSVNS